MLRRGLRINHFSRRFSSTVKEIDYKLNGQDIPDDATVFSMVQPTGKFHLGNYLGATRAWKDLCDLKKDNQRLVFGVADLHAITIPKQDVTEFRLFREEALASILSMGVDPEKAIVMHQSHIPQHSQLHWILSTFTSMGYLNRMTQWKSKSNIHKNNVSEADLGSVKLGLFSYPVLQAADILLYKSTHVPVGDDQTQHLELTRSLALLFNRTYKTNYFPVPVTTLTPTKKILSLNNPEKKMSKSDPNQQGVIYVNDEPEQITVKINKALTDNISDRFYYDNENRPGVSNLINIVSGIQRKEIPEIEKDISNINNYRDFKKYVSEIIIEELRTPRKNFKRLMKEPDYLKSIVDSGNRRARAIAEKNINDIMKIMGLN
ncbi:hypothetical protein TPHA_0C00300 [Tetrapisispora phaffii CBS 4417]|uniref:Tryptophan--tRNA ligase, mitochondrial n=1 Tax=Tetrapisispora phaffii (strain ATCC 24235 / CBS 4417 / NBRC 1672 / NRRL Y-8282 / UCD 70-5) TaxID=1071381 RepID=G8BR11_TETPH|nr:hypothetical protein TPHA_0C00300 [Tetrapisispora phaffii CBS 4417]CCE62187.1 hypothetical protein TPHA_0C00300 [Tetrapisispora phaffii CBS 4417]